MNSIEIKNVSKSYGEIKALDSISADIGKGELFGFIGPDGAGKTTLFRILTSLLVPDSGSAVVEGYDIDKDYRKLRTLLGYMPGRFSLYQDLSIEENLEFFASIFGTTIEENYDLIKDIYVQIEPFKKRRAGKLSGGMKQKLALSCALIHRPEVLVLDEPTTGVDAVSRKEFWEMLRKLKKQGITIVVSTPYMDEAEMCDRVALIQNGIIMGIDKPSSLVSRFDNKLYAVKSGNISKLIKTLKEYEGASSVYPFGEYIHYTGKGEVDTHALCSHLEQKGLSEIDIHEIDPGIEDTFMALMVENDNGK